ncbi:hypothetical protein Lesp02_68310 [Lentzea sp. NBRC 105346]|uniref:hypothetical protein n=1 Tax=Lentzea sp. NBRC 105346 TaxID=3032205 RepID=UPI0024A15EBC|nr:hypothetical protein [Lentzea sp. NBRC 105346]GLZ34644.1 hypothetical protein Lesp02_68310 [Lentzea sp. NBRC 105346]
MKFRSVATLAVVLMSAGCGVNVPAGLEDKLKACPDMLKPEPVAVITKGLEVTEAKLERDTRCSVKVQGDRTVLDIGLIAYPSPELAKQNTGALCRGSELDSNQSCEVTSPGGGRFIVHATAGRWEVRVAVYEVEISDDVKDAARQILKNLRSSSKTK